MDGEMRIFSMYRMMCQGRARIVASPSDVSLGPTVAILIMAECRPVFWAHGVLLGITVKWGGRHEDQIAARLDCQVSRGRPD